MLFLVTMFKQTYLLFVHFLECLLLFLDDNMEEEKAKFSIIKSLAPGCCYAFA